MGIKVQDGCNNECSYCIVHKLRGKEKSIDSNDVLSEYKRLSADNVPELVLTGINTGKYYSNYLNLTSLAKEILSLNMPSRIRVSSIEPADFDLVLVELAEESKGMLCRHFHIPFQAGSTKTLLQMNRNYDADFARRLIESIRKVSPTASISTDIIVGFPGESTEDFEETLKFCEDMRFSKIHVFPYSQREGTPAAERLDQLDFQTKKSRAQSLQKLANLMRKADLQSRNCTVELAVVESQDDCLTESYHWIKTPNGASLNSLISVEL